MNQILLKSGDCYLTMSEIRFKDKEIYFVQCLALGICEQEEEMCVLISAVDSINLLKME